MKNKTLILIGVLLCVVATDAVEKRFELPVAKVTIKVQDESKAAVTGADVLLGFCDPLTKEDAPFHGQTNADGLLTAEGGCAVNGLGSHIHKPGYYLGWANIPVFRDVDALNHWQPWDATYEVVLRPSASQLRCMQRLAGLKFRQLASPAATT